MVAVIKTGSSIHRILNYNEQKVKEGVAQCVMAANYPKDVEDLSINNKLNRLLKQAALNENVTRNSVHISLNFDPSEKLAHSKLSEIANTYMDKIGFGKQPYLVYQHEDAGHPHIHIVTIKVRDDGSRIDMQNIGRNQSEKARKEIEQSFGLKRAEDSKQRQAYQLKPLNVQKVQFEKSETKRAITNVLDTVLNTYKYTSLPELNAVLQQYNVIADRGNEASRVYQNKEGIIYGITYVDHRTKSVFNGSDLGKQYSAKGIEERCKHIEKLQPTQITTQQTEKQIEAQNQTINKEQKNNFEQVPASAISKALDDLLQPSQSNNYVPNQLKKIKKKKRKHISNKL